jgi:hypothetical protein
MLVLSLETSYKKSFGDREDAKELHVHSFSTYLVLFSNLRKRY